ncbi:hypothetical protein DASB73_017230 [Starmerella bacillaris]|uniref:TFIIS central domain-containing protein n=1 Tax=Starmerella bacillaris TaxID=1247836 RepID=A0AAV5RH49_STABA|nr:hypothetical protein DASB73_017230 [Starmerella bacillaris]
MASSSAASQHLKIDIQDLRQHTSNALGKIFGEDDQSKKMGKDLENALNEKYQAPTPIYKSNFRRLHFTLKNAEENFRDKLLKGEMKVEEFVSKPSKDLKSERQLAADEIMKKYERDQRVTEQLLPENVNQVKDGRDREKWGVSKSAAAIDD